MAVSIYQGNEHSLEKADVNVVIDVFRAFTVAHFAFLQGVKEIILTGTVSDAFELKQKNPEYLLAGEVKGLPIEGFDLDNSPLSLFNQDLTNKILIQKTTNGVKAALHSLDADWVFVTGFSNARETAEYIRRIIEGAGRDLQINIIASHPTGDEDLACAEYMAGIIEARSLPSKKETIERILKSPIAEKFFDESNPAFDRRDLDYCTKELNSGFLMKVESDNGIPTIERYRV